MILLIDNYDSFSYNLWQMLGTITEDIRVVRNDAMRIEEIEELAPQGIVISPGPGRPADAGISEELITKLGGKVPILGVCLGEQAICETYGAVVTYAKTLMHGRQSVTSLDTSSPIFAGIPESVRTARYHSLAVDEKTLPEELHVIARADDGEVMGVAHKDFPVYGLQFHPESIMTEYGADMLKNFTRICGI